VALSAPACAPNRPEPEEETVTFEEGDCTGTGAVTIRVAGRDRVFPFEELRGIRREAVRYLAEEDPALEPGVLDPGEVSIDCWGTARMGAWILESAHSAEPALHLTYRVHTGDAGIVRQVIRLEPAGDSWRATGTDVETAHALR
jgi:hypothetical protein